MRQFQSGCLSSTVTQGGGQGRGGASRVGEAVPVGMGRWKEPAGQGGDRGTRRVTKVRR